ncbi:YVTN family beta-propeller repeat protein [Rhodopila globiformis]|uniref:Pesticidal protein Cry11Aa n=1 Tax=Rhodopila globiformis TaxID=1071 RepID=A0A2S6NN65_RHOGL|nr:beta-propeller fold lactonase family protein [Rhodopila globiformis]PPQ38309.1 pesticidal protein Cry11Aa [Rhodopila globiformis]
MRRVFLVLAYVLAIGAAAPAWAAGIAFVVNSNSASISVIDMATQKEVRRIPALREPHHVALSPDGKSLLVGDTAGNQMMFLDPNTGAVQKRLPMADPYQLQFSPDGRYLVVNGLARNQVDVYDAAGMKLLKRFPVVATPSHLTFSPDSATVFVTLQDSDKLAAFDLRTMTEKWTVPVGRTPAGTLWLNGHVLVTDMGTDYIAVVDPSDGKVLEHVVTGRGAHQLFLSPDRKVLWVNNRAGGTTVTLDAATLKLIRRYAIPGGPDDLAFAPDGKVWITRRWAEKVAVLDPQTGHYGSIQVGRSPHGLFLNPSAPSPTVVSSR